MGRVRSQAFSTQHFGEDRDTDVGAPVRMTVKANFNLLTPHAQIANDPRRLSSCVTDRRIGSIP